MRVILSLILLSVVSFSAEIKVYAVVIGKVKEVLVKEGQRVKKGELLLKIEDSIYKAREKQFSGELAVAKADLYKVRRDYERLKELFDRDLLSLTRLEDQKAKLDRVLGNIQRAEGKLEEVKILRSYTEIYSPAEGTVKAIFVGEGSYVNGTFMPQLLLIIKP